ncbi:MAG: hypothetical protein ACYS8L_02275 [Planctomycetota bacterium]
MWMQIHLLSPSLSSGQRSWQLCPQTMKPSVVYPGPQRAELEVAD